jgi:hypothetical protein
MGFSVKIAPGVRVRASSRGVRTSIGPRGARVHVGGGRSTTVSSGVGPITLYGSLGSSRGSTRRSTSVASYQRQVAAAARQNAAAQKAHQARELAAAFNALLSVHREEFEPAIHPRATRSPLPEAAVVRARHEADALKGIGLFKRAERKAAKERAAVSAQAELDTLLRKAEVERLARQAELDRLWARLMANDPDVVMATLADAFDDNEAAAGPIDVDGTEVTLVVLAPDETIVPERAPSTTAAGNPTLRKLPKGERAALYTSAVLGHVLVTIREAFAVAPNIMSAKVATLRYAGSDAYGNPHLECLLAGRWTREAFNGVRWEEASAATVIEDTATDLLVNLGAKKELKPLDLRREPDLVTLLDRVDASSLLD